MAPGGGITIHRFGGLAFTIDELTAKGRCRRRAVVEETAAVLGAGRNVLMSGSTGSGKATLLNALVSLLPTEGPRHLDRRHAGAGAYGAPTDSASRPGASPARA